jgi:DNA invertase Pin-like site-specific DNA recombinase
MRYLLRRLESLTEYKSEFRMEKIAIYLRVSTADQSATMQRDELMAWCRSKDYTIHEIYEDVASGGSTGKRPNWHRLMADAGNKDFQLIVVWKLDRWARSLTDLVTSLQMLDEIGIKFISIKDQIDFSSATGRLMFHILGAFADFELQIIKERVRAGISAARRRGIRLGKPRRINHENVKDLRQQGLSLSEIAKRVGATKAGIQKVLRKV